MFIDCETQYGSKSVRSSMCRRLLCDTFLPDIDQSPAYVRFQTGGFPVFTSCGAGS